MRIERVDEKTIKCFLSNEELEQYEIDYKDFVMRSDKARAVVQEIISQAKGLVIVLHMVVSSNLFRFLRESDHSSRCVPFCLREPDHRYRVCRGRRGGTEVRGRGQATRPSGRRIFQWLPSRTGSRSG